MTAEELMTIANMGKGTDMSSYEHFMMAEKSARRPSGVGIAGLAIGSTALLAAVGAWIFGGVYANSQSKGNQRAIDILATTALAERAERVNHQNNQTPNNLDIIRIITNAQSGAGAGAGANASALAQAEALALLLNGGSGRNGQVNPQPVALYQPAMPCCCNTGCGCNQ
jgi:hypothetical protein|nr:MAG: hypothetical protein [Bacteriophage sp.]UWD62291.1 MAG: hypothetical protein [Bacteriophage sp.]UWD69350.1 MAG: hypothetical protein [Bacteriophage sp.]UWD76844.1 MAG: hypothetical protein [Bacteriophage sp.]DAW11914.1 MAG TPA: hypothetical protein [Caudoviricetes sp.]